MASDQCANQSIPRNVTNAQEHRHSRIHVYHGKHVQTRTSKHRLPRNIATAVSMFITANMFKHGLQNIDCPGTSPQPYPCLSRQTCSNTDIKTSTAHEHRHSRIHVYNGEHVQTRTSKQRPGHCFTRLPGSVY